MNIVGFAWPEIVYLSPRAPGGPVPNLPDDILFSAQFVLVDGKFRGLFTLLFGASLLLFVERADARGEGGITLQLRRLSFLALFGLAHFFLLWWGDILFLYAVCGFAVLGMIDWEARTLIRRALIIYAVGTAWLLASNLPAALPWFLPGVEGHQATQRLVEQFDRAAQAETALALGPWTTRLADSVFNHWQQPLVTVANYALETIPLMMFGMALLKDGFFAGAWDTARYRRWAWRGIAGGLVLTLPLAWWQWREEFALQVVFLVGLALALPGRLAMTLGFAALLVPLARSAPASWLGERIIAAGRMAFSNYIGTSLAMAFIFQGWGLAYFARYTRVELLGFVVLGWLLMLAWSRPWLERYRQGPLEWLWRSLVRRRREPFRR
ncbi:DUF418 domain-containing protein [Novosphingobium tardum]|uniref:DUF418 domain-containing protein n=1 Tax=Novosphingobium tardum TaxID=1538021 RepID=A0ABV8RMD7_9SPHN